MMTYGFSMQLLVMLIAVIPSVSTSDQYEGVEAPLPFSEAPSKKEDSHDPLSRAESSSTVVRIIQVVSPEKALRDLESTQIKHVHFTVPSVERKYVQEFVEGALQRSVLIASVGLILFGIYGLLGADWFVSFDSIGSWGTAANIAFNGTWIMVILSGFAGIVLFTWKTKKERTASGNSALDCEQVVLGWSVVLITLVILFGNRWRAAKSTGTPFVEAFGSHMEWFPDVEIAVALSEVVVFLCVCTRVRFRRVLPVCFFAWLLYSVTAVAFGLPKPMTEEVDRMQGLFLSVWLLLLYVLCLTGKYQLEMLQRRAFLDLQLAHHRLNKQELTLTALENGDSALGQSNMEKAFLRIQHVGNILERMRLGKPGAKPGDDLEQAVELIRKTERAVSLMSVQKEVLIAKATKGLDFSQHALADMLDSVVRRDSSVRVRTCRLTKNGRTHSGGSAVSNTPHSAASPLKSPRLGLAASPFNRRLEMESPLGRHALGVFGLSMMKRMGRDAELDMAEVQHQLVVHSSSDLPVIVLAGRALIEPYCGDPDIGGLGSAMVFPNSVGDLRNFLLELANHYWNEEAKVFFHTQLLGAQTAHLSFILFNILGLRARISRLDCMSLVIASLGLHVGNFGVRNGFLVRQHHELARLYNDRCVLENHACSSLFEILRASKSGSHFGFFDVLSKEKLLQLREMVIHLILGSAEVFHFSNLADLRLRLAANFLSDEEPEEVQAADSKLVLMGILRSAQLGFSTLPWESHQSWAGRLLEEWWGQGDLEKEQGVTVSPLCEREGTEGNFPEIGRQMGVFITTVVSPYLEALKEVCKRMNYTGSSNIDPLLARMELNGINWDAWLHASGDVSEPEIFIPLPPSPKPSPGSKRKGFLRNKLRVPPATVAAFELFPSNGACTDLKIHHSFTGERGKHRRRRSTLSSPGGPARKGQDKDNEREEHSGKPFFHSRRSNASSEGVDFQNTIPEAQEDSDTAYQEREEQFLYGGQLSRGRTKASRSDEGNKMGVKSGTPRRMGAQ